MASFKRLTRGIKLLLEHFYTPLNEVRTELVTTGLNSDDLETGYSTFRLNFYIPYVNQSTKKDDADRFGTVTAPFVLPAPQDSFDLDKSLIQDYELTDVSISFDSRSEPKNVSGVQVDPTFMTEGYSAESDVFGFTMHLTEKIIDNSTGAIGEPFSNEVYKLTIPSISLIDDYRRANPHVQSDLSISLRHDRSYLMEFVPSKTGWANGVSMFSVNVSLKIKRRLMPRDGADTQNMPSHNGALNPPSVTITTPASNTLIQASGATGIQTNYEAIDGLVSSGLRGGYLRSGEREDDEVIKDSAGYEVIAVPLFAGYSAGASGPLVGPLPSRPDCTYTAVNMPYATAGAGNFMTMDRAIIPLHYPITIQHVILARSYTNPNNVMPATRPTLANLAQEVGVGLLSGIRSDNFTYTQVAYASWKESTVSSYLIDRSNLSFDPSFPLTHFIGYAWDLMSCPLTGFPTDPGSGYINQGKPIFAGQGTTPTETRSTVNNVAPPTAGAEQALEIRWLIHDPVGDPAASPAGEVVVGWPCNWVYIIGKKHLV